MPSHFSYKHRVNFYETDMAGLVHFSNYFRFMEETEQALFLSLGFSLKMKEQGQTITWPRVATSFEYKSPIHVEDLIEIRLLIEHLGEKSLAYRVEFYTNQKLAALGSCTMVCCRLKKEGVIEGIRIPERIRKKLSPYLARRKSSA